MSLKILGGKLKGLSFNPGKAFRDRPTSVMLRRKLFDANQQLDSITFVDLCAGTGMMGIEAYSRGSEQIYLGDVNKSYLRAISQFLKKHEIESSFVLEGRDATSLIRKLIQENDSFDDWIFFLDPPYENKNVYQECFNLLKDLPGNKEIWIEGCKQKNFTHEELRQQFGTYDKIFEQGTNYIAVYRL